MQPKLFYPSTKKQRNKNYTNLNERNLLQTRESELYTYRGFLSSLKYVRLLLSLSLLMSVCVCVCAEQLNALIHFIYHVHDLFVCTESVL